MTTYSCDFALAIVKGLVEHDDGTKYFGSLIGYKEHERVAIERGYCVIGPKRCLEGDYHEFFVEATRLTDAGRAVYVSENLDLLPKTGRAYGWDWSKGRQ